MTTVKCRDKRGGRGSSSRLVAAQRAGTDALYRARVADFHRAHSRFQTRWTLPRLL